MTFLLTAADKVKAETTQTNKTFFQWFMERGDVRNNPYANSGIAEGMSVGDNFNEAMELWIKIGNAFMAVIDWINNLNENIGKMSVNLLAWVYEAVSNVVLRIPPFLFTTDAFAENIIMFSAVAIGLSTLGFVINGAKQTFNFSHDKLGDIIKRFGIVIVAMGFMPVILEKSFTIVNKLASIITKLGYSQMHVSGGVIPSSVTSGFDTFALLLFDVLLIGTLIPVFLQNARRYFDLFALSALSPLALSCWIFKDTRHYYTQWLAGIISICKVQLVYASFITLLGLLMFMTSNVVSGWGLLFKLLMLAGGLYRMSHPPRIVKGMMDTSQGSITDVFTAFKSMYTLKGLNLANPINLGSKVGKGVMKMFK